MRRRCAKSAARAPPGSKVLIDVSRLPRFFLSVLVLLAGLGVPARAEEPPAKAFAVRVEQRGEDTRLAFDLTAPVRAEAFAVEGPRIVVDLPQVAFLIDPAIGRETAKPSARVLKGAKTLIRSYRFGQFAPGRARVVIDLAAPARVVRAESVKNGEGARLEIDLAPQDATLFAQAAAEHARATLAAPPTPPVEPSMSEKGGSRLPLVVIDPGHGGVDVGASGRHGEIEKSIAFEFAKALKAKIEEKGQQRVLLTRSDDVFVPLDERVRFAQEHAAALLLSIHADTLGAANVSGATVYTGAARASDAEAARIAAKENRADEAAGLERKAEAEEVGDILFELTRRETRALSKDFAAAVIGKWRTAGNLNKNPNRAARFVVLKAHDVPSALLELGYLSSDKDVADLTSPQWRERAAGSVAEAIASYFQARERNIGAAIAQPTGAMRPH